MCLECFFYPQKLFSTTMRVHSCRCRSIMYLLTRGVYMVYIDRQLHTCTCTCTLYMCMCHSSLSSLDDMMEDKKALVVSGLKIVLHEQSLRVSH